MYHHRTCDVKTMCYIVFISHSLHWCYIKTALQEYVMNLMIHFQWCTVLISHSFHYRTVLETLKGVDPDRRCFRMVGGILVERTVKEIVPALTNNKQQV